MIAFRLRAHLKPVSCWRSCARVLICATVIGCAAGGRSIRELGIEWTAPSGDDLSLGTIRVSSAGITDFEIVAREAMGRPASDECIFLFERVSTAPLQGEFMVISGGVRLQATPYCGYDLTTLLKEFRIPWCVPEKGDFEVIFAADAFDNADDVIRKIAALAQDGTGVYFAINYPLIPDGLTDGAHKIALSRIHGFARACTRQPLATPPSPPSSPDRQRN